MPTVLPDLRAILEHTYEVVWLLDPSSGKLHYINGAFETLWGRRVEQLLVAPSTTSFLSSTVHPDDRARYDRGVELRDMGGGHLDIEYRILRPNGEVRWVRSRSRPYLGGEGLIVGMNEDITERKRHEEQLEAHRRELEEAYARLQEAVITDPLTGLKNRRGLQAGLERVEADARRHRTAISVVATDIDHFKLYNDAYGHPAGDNVLVAVSTIIQRSMRPTDLAARVGGEEFVVLLPDTDRSGAIAAAERIRRAVAYARWPHRPVTASFGCSTWHPDEACSPSTLFAAADKAMYESKNTGRNRVTHILDMAQAEIAEPLTV